MNIRRMGVVLALAALVLGTAAAEAGEVRLPAARSAVITDPSSGGVRELVAFAAEPGQFRGQFVVSAFLEIPVAADTELREIDLELVEPTRSWMTATWTAPWSRPGGDFELDDGVALTIQTGEAATLRVNVTDLIRDAVEDGRPPNGFLLLPGRTTDRAGFTGDEAVRLRTGEAELIVRTRRVPRART